AGGAVGVGGDVGRGGGPAFGQPRRGQPVQQRRAAGVALPPGGEGLLPLRAQPLAPVGDLARVRDRLVLRGEAHLGVEAEDALGLGHLLGAERGAVRRAGVLRVWRGPGDDRPQRDERRTVGALPGRGERAGQRRDVLVIAVRGTPGDPLHVPAVRLVPRADILRLGNFRIVFDRDVVV